MALNVKPNSIARTAFITAAVLLSTVAVQLAAQQSEPVFEVASIKESKTDTNRVSMNVLPGGRLVATNISLETLVAGAYGSNVPLPPNRVVMPAAWAGSGAPRFDIEAKPDREFRQGELLIAVRHLLEDRFKLAVHHEMREQPGYALVMDRADGRLGSRLKRSDVDCTDPVENGAKDADGTLKCGIRGRAGSATGKHTMAVLARFLTNVVPDHRTVTDRTNLVGTYEFQIDWAPEVSLPSVGAPGGSSDADATSIFTAVREQLGLRLDSDRQQVDVLIVDRAERPTEN
jgi:uncharacterized protein (TIGR03435 family)